MSIDLTPIRALVDDCPNCLYGDFSECDVSQAVKDQVIAHLSNTRVFEVISLDHDGTAVARTYYADDVRHAHEQHKHAFPEESAVDVELAPTPSVAPTLCGARHHVNPIWCSLPAGHTGRRHRGRTTKPGSFLDASWPVQQEDPSPKYP